MTSTALIIFCLAFFITGSTAFWDIFGRDETARRHAYEKLNGDIRVITGHYNRLLKQVEHERTKYNLVWSGVFAPVTKEIQDVRTKVSKKLDPLNGNRLDVNGDCHKEAKVISEESTNVQQNVSRCWTDSETRVNEIAEILTKLYNDETQFLENFKSVVDTMSWYQLLLEKQKFAVRRQEKIRELTTAKNNLVAKINQESGGLSKCVQDKYSLYREYRARFVRSIKVCVGEKLKSPRPEESSDKTGRTPSREMTSRSNPSATLSTIASPTNKPSTNPVDHIEHYTIPFDYDDR